VKHHRTGGEIGIRSGFRLPADRAAAPGLARIPSDAPPGHDEKARDATGMGHSWGDGDPIERALALALEAATAAGRFDVVAKIAQELEARRLVRAPNVVAIESRRPR
jgi:hypothetical protein